MDTDRNGARVVLVVEDNPFNRDGLVLFLQTQGYATLEAGDQQTAIELARAHRPPLAIVDIVLPRTPDSPADHRLSVGLEVVVTLKQLDPNIGIVIFSAHEDRGPDVWEMVQHGLRGIAYLLKGNRPERVIYGLEEAAAGRVLLEPDVTRTSNQLYAEMYAQLSDDERPLVERAAALIPSLTPRELEVAWRVAASHTNQSIAESLDLAPKTIETYIANIYRKLLLNDVEAMRKSTLLAKAIMLYQMSHRR